MLRLSDELERLSTAQITAFWEAFAQVFATTYQLERTMRPQLDQHSAMSFTVVKILYFLMDMIIDASSQETPDFMLNIQVIGDLKRFKEDLGRYFSR